jgi:cell division protein FtsI/penicillin-binding protein 2
LIDKLTDSSGKETAAAPQVIMPGVVKPEVGATIREFMEYTVQKNYLTYGMSKPRPEFSVGGKTGTAEVPKPGGGYYDDRFNGTFIGFVGGDEVQYVIVVRVNEPAIGGYAGSKAAAPIFGSLADLLINNYGVTPRSRLN